MGRVARLSLSRFILHQSWNKKCFIRQWTQSYNCRKLIVPDIQLWSYLVFKHRPISCFTFALIIAFAVLQSGRAEPTAPIPKEARDKYNQAQELEKEGRTQEAIAAYQEAIRLGMQTYPRAHLKEANGYLDLKDFDAAIAKYSKFIERFGLEDSCRY
jgi:tetratricopeptide (TPR) repeat protein